MSSTTDRRPFPFLSLPPELRDQIYTYLLSTQHPIDIFRYQKRFTCAKSSDSNEENPEGIHIPVAILRTCRQIQAEATPIIYSINRFVFTFPGVFTSFMRRTRGARWMRDVEITHPLDRGAVLGALKVLKHGVERLERLVLGGSIRKVLAPNEAARRLVSLIRKMGETNGDRGVEKTLKRVVFLQDAGYHARASRQIEEWHRREFEGEVKGLLREELGDKA